MQCPECGTWTQVLETRKQSDYMRRRYQCANMHRFTTKEVVVTAKRSLKVKFDRHNTASHNKTTPAVGEETKKAQ